jgi:hypothetical protein
MNSTPRNDPYFWLFGAACLAVGIWLGWLAALWAFVRV